MTGVERHVFEFFPECADLLRALIPLDHGLAELCSDFDAVVVAQHASVSASDSHARARADEYHGLRIEIEGEILERVRRYRQGRSGSALGDASAP